MKRHFLSPNISPHFPSNPSSTKHFPSQKKSTFSLSHLMARVVMITRRRSRWWAHRANMGRADRLLPQKKSRSLCAPSEVTLCVGSRGVYLEENPKIKSPGRNVYRLFFEYELFWSSKNTKKATARGVLAKVINLTFFGTYPLNQLIFFFNWQSIRGAESEKA